MATGAAAWVLTAVLAAVVAGVVRLYAYVPHLAAMLPRSLAEAAAGRPEELRRGSRLGPAGRPGLYSPLMLAPSELDARLDRLSEEVEAWSRTRDGDDDAR